MEYTQIDPDKAVDAMLAANALEQSWQSYLHTLDVDALSWCADIAELCECDSSVARKQSDESKAQVADAAAKAETFCSRMTVPAIPDLSGKKEEFLPGYIAQLEAEHAQHEMLAKIAEAEGNEEQAIVHHASMLRCEASHTLVLAELGTKEKEEIVVKAEPKGEELIDAPAEGGK